MKTLGSQETGARAASPIWVSFMHNVIKDEPEAFPLPEGIVSYLIDPETGLLTRDETIGEKEYFKKGTEPKQFSQNLLIRKIKEKFINPNFD